MDVWEAIKNKRAVRAFTDAPLPDDVVQRILDAGRRAQSAKNSQPWQFIAIQDRDTLQQLAQLGDWMGHVAGAALCVAILNPAQPDERHTWHMFDAGQAAAYMQLAALELGVGSCPGTVYQPDAARDLLGFPPEWELNLVLSFGYPDPEQQRPGKGAAGRRAYTDVVHSERWSPMA